MEQVIPIAKATVGARAFIRFKIATVEFTDVHEQLSTWMKTNLI